MAPNDATPKKVFTLDDIATADGTRYAIVDAHGGEWTIGTLSTASVVDWSEMRKVGTPDAKVDASMYLIARSLVFGGEGNYTRVPDEQVQAVASSFKIKDDTENGKIVSKILELNNFLKKDKDENERGNDSGEATSDASPIA